jgi:hypothetical protein
MIEVKMTVNEMTLVLITSNKMTKQNDQTK